MSLFKEHLKRESHLVPAPLFATSASTGIIPEMDPTTPHSPWIPLLSLTPVTACSASDFSTFNPRSEQIFTIVHTSFNLLAPDLFVLATLPSPPSPSPPLLPSLLLLPLSVFSPPADVGKVCNCNDKPGPSGNLCALCSRDCFGTRNRSSLIIKSIYHFSMILHVDFMIILYINPLQPCHMLLCAYNYLSACVHVYGCVCGACVLTRRYSCSGWVTSTVFEAHVPQCLQVCAGHAHSIPIACSRATVSCVGFCDGRREPCPVDPHDRLCSPCIQEERIPRL